MLAHTLALFPSVTYAFNAAIQIKSNTFHPMAHRLSEDHGRLLVHVATSVGMLKPLLFVWQDEKKMDHGLQ